MIAEELVAHFDNTKASIEKIEIAGPGFINFYMNNSYLTDLIPDVLELGTSMGKQSVGNQQKVQVEFVSANPTGDLHLGHARGAAVGDSLCNILQKRAMMFPVNTILMMLETKLIILRFLLKHVISKRLAWKKKCQKMAIMVRILSALERL